MDPIPQQFSYLTLHSKANLVLVIRNIYITSSYTYEMYVYSTFHTNKSYLTCTFAATKHKFKYIHEQKHLLLIHV